MRKYKNKATRGKTPIDIIIRAVKTVKDEGKSTRSVAKDVDIVFRTLARYFRNSVVAKIVLTMFFTFRFFRQIKRLNAPLGSAGSQSIMVNEFRAFIEIYEAIC